MSHKSVLNKLGVSFVVFMGLMGAQASWAKAGSDYTSISVFEEDPKHCKVVEETNYGAQTFDCSTLDKEYHILAHAYDLKINIALNHGDKYWTYEPNAPHATQKLLEWRYQNHQGKKTYTALIYRILVSDGEKYHPRMLVMRLDKDKSCYLGVIKQGNLNEQARKLADDPKAVCLPNNDFRQEGEDYPAMPFE